MCFMSRSSPSVTRLVWSGPQTRTAAAHAALRGSENRLGRDLSLTSLKLSLPDHCRFVKYEWGLAPGKVGSL